MASGGTFRFRVLVGMRRVPLHARNASTAWCMHPRFIPNEQIVFIPEPRILSPIEASSKELLGLRYLVRLRLVAF